MTEGAQTLTAVQPGVHYCGAMHPQFGECFRDLGAAGHDDGQHESETSTWPLAAAETAELYAAKADRMAGVLEHARNQGELPAAVLDQVISELGAQHTGLDELAGVLGGSRRTRMASRAVVLPAPRRAVRRGRPRTALATTSPATTTPSASETAPGTDGDQAR
jgi:hypothetical protein